MILLLLIVGIALYFLPNEILEIVKILVGIWFVYCICEWLKQDKPWWPK